ncbi:unnamed protein product [Psylliodes chrysocephalus]|uniref:SAP domain-containing protein n=1 Tax=Psylliodes chrysocephalus TaxID=3402493 RepID=A0A9P0GB74_9CUCU|nr:unnamed protein product [Psylliodes chrysocephala]
MSYSNWKLNSLKDELKRRGAIMRGKKAELIERLEAYDRNFNFGFVAVDNENSAPKMCLPPPETFKDVHCGIKLNIDISKTRVETYLQSFDQNITEKSAQLFQSKFVQYLKFSSTGSGVFFNSSVKAAMKKILYHVDIFITTDNSIEQCQCECAAGEGTQAHCKHITAVLLTVAMFCERKVLWIEEACTTQLQTFHQPKTKFNRSPIKATELPVLGNSNNNFDPRPQHNSIRQFALTTPSSTRHEIINKVSIEEEKTVIECIGLTKNKGDNDQFKNIEEITKEKEYEEKKLVKKSWKIRKNKRIGNIPRHQHQTTIRETKSKPNNKVKKKNKCKNR